MGANFREQLAAKGARGRRKKGATKVQSSVELNFKSTYKYAQRKKVREIRKMQKEIEYNVNRLREYVEGVKERRRKWLEYAADPVIKMMKSKAPVYQGGFYHTRYVYQGGKNKKRSPKGQGKIAATYLPGNLQGSIGIIPLESSKVHIGPIFNKSGTTTGTFGEWRFDPYYFFFVEYGTRTSNYPRQPFLRPSVAALPQAYNRVLLALKNYTQKFIAEGK